MVSFRFLFSRSAAESRERFREILRENGANLDQQTIALKEDLTQEEREVELLIQDFFNALSFQHKLEQNPTRANLYHLKLAVRDMGIRLHAISCDESKASALIDRLRRRHAIMESVVEQSLSEYSTIANT